MKMRGFTVLEVMVAIIVLGVLAGVAFQRFSFMMEDSKITEARASLAAIVAAEKVYRLNNSSGNFWRPNDTNVGAINTNLGLDLMPRDYNTSWRIENHASGFRARVCRGNANNFCVLVDANGNYTTTGSFG